MIEIFAESNCREFRGFSNDLRKLDHAKLTLWNKIPRESTPFIYITEFESNRLIQYCQHCRKLLNNCNITNSLLSVCLLWVFFCPAQMTCEIAPNLKCDKQDVRSPCCTVTYKYLRKIPNWNLPEIRRNLFIAVKYEIQIRDTQKQNGKFCSHENYSLVFEVAPL